MRHIFFAVVLASVAFGCGDAGQDVPRDGASTPTPDSGITLLPDANPQLADAATADARPGTTPDAAPNPTGRPDIAPVEEGWLRGDLHVHTNYSDDALEQQGDWIAPLLTITDAWRAPVWLDAYPEYERDHLHFVAFTDHRSTDSTMDPDFHHDYLVVVGGEEFGSDGHAGVFGSRTHVTEQPSPGQTHNQRLQAAIGEVHAQGAVFSINHPTLDGDVWIWDVEGFDGIEVWNGPWSLAGTDLSEERVDEVKAQFGGTEGPVIRMAARFTGSGKNAQAVRFWQGYLSLGVHVPPIGGSDRHVLFALGLPTTYVLTESRDEEGVVAGIAAGHTFVSRSPLGPQVVLTAIVNGVEYPMGSALPQTAGPIQVRWQVARATGGVLRMVAGVVDPSMPDPTITEIALPTNSESGTFQWTPPAGGGWLHAIVVDPLPSDYPPEFQAAFNAFTAFPESSLAIIGLVGGLLPIADLGSLLLPGLCDPSAWTVWRMQCMPADELPLGSIYVSEQLQKMFSTEFLDKQATGYAMGAISAAFHTNPTR